MDSAMFDAAARGDVATVVSLTHAHPHLIDAAHPDQLGRTPLHFAARNGQASVVEALHKLGSSALDQPDDICWTPMHTAAAYGHASVVETLHRLGATALDQPISTGSTPMHVAALNGHAPVVETLVRLGSATLDTPNKYGKTPMHLAARDGRTAVVETLIRLGSATPLRSGTDVLASAFCYNRMDVAQLLLAAGVDAAALQGRYPQQVRALLATTGHERLLYLRHRLYFSSSLLDVLLAQLDVRHDDKRCANRPPLSDRST